MDKLLVVGASGLLGSAAFELGSKSYETFGTYNKNARPGMVQLDSTDRAKVFELVKSIKPNIVFDCHALNNADYCEAHPDEGWAINFEGSRNIAEASKEVGAKYVFVSSDYLYSGGKEIYSEKDKPDPRYYYGRLKWAMQSFLEIMDIDSIVVITTGLYGKQGSTGKKSFVPFIIENIQKGTRTEVISDQYICYTLVDDIVGSVFELCKQNARGWYNIVAKDCLSKYEFALLISKEFKLDSSMLVPVSASQLPNAPKRPDKVKLSTRKLKAAIGHAPMSAKKGLKIIHREMKAAKKTENTQQ